MNFVVVSCSENNMVNLIAKISQTEVLMVDDELFSASNIPELLQKTSFHHGHFFRSSSPN
jgi:PleD family two-component response regulator